MAAPNFICEKVTPVTKSDSVAIGRTIGIYVGGTGDVTVQGSDGVQATFKAVPVGTILWGNFPYVMATGTTATLMVALMG